jgi:hypothetical protein
MDTSTHLQQVFLKICLERKGGGELRFSGHLVEEAGGSLCQPVQIRNHTDILTGAGDLFLKLPVREGKSTGRRG